MEALAFCAEAPELKPALIATIAALPLAGEPVAAPLLPTHYRERVAALWDDRELRVSAKLDR